MSREGKRCFTALFDCVADQKKTIEQLIGLGADRILTSGGAPDVWSGRERLKQLQKEYGSEIEILAGSGVNENNVRELMTYTEGSSGTQFMPGMEKRHHNFE